MKIQEIISHLDAIAPPSYQESYDNAGLLTGDASAEATAALLCLDATEEVIEEAIALGCNLVIAHHPIIFRGLKRLTGSNYVERTIIKAIRHDVAIFAIHTNLDNVFRKGVNSKIAERLGLKNTRILAPKQGLKKLSAFAPAEQVEPLRAALFEAGAGSVNGFEQASFAALGVATSAVSQPGQLANSPIFQLDVLFPAARRGAVVSTLQRKLPGGHFEIISLENQNLELGAGLVGELPEAMEEGDFLKHVKTALQTACIRHTRLLEKPVRTVAVCGGAGSFLLPNAISQRADAFVTADFKYHEFFDADRRILVADVGHFESEQFTMQLLREIIEEKFSTFATHLTKVVTNPVFYF